MSSAANPAALGASLFTALYPRAFRDEFGEEMRDVLEQSFLDAANRGALAVCWVGLRELVDLPANLLREYLRQVGRKGYWLMNRLSPSPIDRAGQLGALGYGLGFAMLGLIFVVMYSAEAYQTAQPVYRAITWIAASFLAGCLGGAGIGLGADPRHIRKFALLAGAALALANLASLASGRMGVTWYILNMGFKEISIGFSLISMLLVGPLTGLFLGWAQGGYRRGLTLAGIGFFAFMIGFFIPMLFFAAVAQGYSFEFSANNLPPIGLVGMMAFAIMGIIGSISGIILGRCAADWIEMQNRSPVPSP